MKELVDIREYSDNELSMLVFNDESLYNMRHLSNLESILREIYIFSDDQLEVLKVDVEMDLEG